MIRMVRIDELIAQIHTQTDRQNDQTNGARFVVEHFESFRMKFEWSLSEVWKRFDEASKADSELSVDEFPTEA